MRGVYTGGVLETFMTHGVEFPYVIGMSAGACNAVSYLSKQRGRNRRVTIDYAGRPDYLSFRNWWKTGSAFGMDLIFRRIPNELDPLDYEALFASETTFVVGATDPETGAPVYFANEAWGRDPEAFLTIVRASSSLPLFAPPVAVGDRLLFDGGVADPIPVRKALEDGCDRVVVVLTKDASYRIKPFRGRTFWRMLYRGYPRLVEAMERRERVYNETMVLLDRLQAEGRAFVIRPSAKLPVSRMERDVDKLHTLYALGERDAADALPRLADWAKRASESSAIERA